MSIDWKSVQGTTQEPTRDVLWRYVRLTPLELRALRGQLSALATAEEDGSGYLHRAWACELVLRWHPEAAEWEWERIYSSPNLWMKGRAVGLALMEWENADLREVLLRATQLLTFEQETFEKGLEELDRDLMGHDPNFGHLLRVEKASRESPESYHTVYRALTRVGWPGIEDGTRAGLRKLTRAIMWLSDGDATLPGPSLEQDLFKQNPDRL